MIVEHQPQNVITTTLSVRLAAQYAQHVESCKGWGNWRVLCAVCVCLHCGRVHTFFLLPLCFQRCSAIVFFHSFSLSSVAIQVSNLLCPCTNRLPFLWGFLHTILSIFGCWCSNGSSIYLPNPFGEHKTNILNVHSIELLQALNHL